ncbi:hypothetical protein C8Q79DRAFT_899341, partial [Trametes meyenii]
RRDLAGAYVGDPDTLWHHMKEHWAAVGGEAALCFLLRRLDALPHDLELYAPRGHWQALQEALLNDVQLNLRLQGVISGRAPRYPASTGSLRPRELEPMSLYADRIIHVHHAYVDSCLAPLATSSTTALINYVAFDALACAYPYLTFNLRAIASPPVRRSVHERLMCARLSARFGFEFEDSPAAWPDLAASVGGTTTDWPPACLRPFGLCPGQGRFFGDRASLVAYFDPVAVNEEDLRWDHQLPFRASLVWRLGCGRGNMYPCAQYCRAYDPWLSEGTDIMLLMIAHRGSVINERYLTPY